jgi:hypothetical protein
MIMSVAEKEGMIMSVAELVASRPEAFSVVDPGTRDAVQDASPAKGGQAARLNSLEGAVVALIDNGMGSSSLLKEALVARLKGDYGVGDVIDVRKSSVSVPPRAEDWAAITGRADAGIALFGGCGSCSARTVRDAIELEWAGIPAVPVIHEALVGSATAMRRMSKMADYPVVEVKYPARPTAIWSDDETKAVLDYVLPQVVERLVQARG